MPTPSTPCINVCVIDPQSGLCRGCLRTIPEITAWSRMTESERMDVMSGLPARRPLVQEGVA